MEIGSAHLAYCTNVHPGETWPETFSALETYALRVREQIAAEKRFALGLRLSSQASEQLLEGDQLPRFKEWLEKKNLYVFTINGFPYGNFHGTRVKEQVYRPDWSTPERLDYTQRLFKLIAALCPKDSGGSVSSLPGSFKAFAADEKAIFRQLETCAAFIDELAQSTDRDLHLGLEPEPLGHFENTEETLAFFDRFLNSCKSPDTILNRIGINYDTCHFSLEYDECKSSLNTLTNAGLRISKIHLSNALTLDPRTPEAVSLLESFDEPTYLHQVLTRTNEGTIERFKDIPDALTHANRSAEEWRIHFHIPLYSAPAHPLGSTSDHVQETLNYLQKKPSTCSHLEIETYTWGVLPKDLQRPVTDMIVDEYRWVLERF